MRTVAPFILFLACLPGTGLAQEHVHAVAVLDAPVDATPHLRVTPARAANAHDSLRALEIVKEARRAVGRYVDVTAAERDGYRVFAPRVKLQRVLHYANRTNALRARVAFDPTRPSALLYRRERDGSLRLLGVMYTMPSSATLDELDARIPLSLAQWHLHTNICIPRDRTARASADNLGPAARFGPHGSIATARECSAAGGRFREQSLGWMVHVNVMEDDFAKVWGSERHMH